MTNSFDVVIIGGGIIGTSTGYYLSKKGLKVALIEKDYLTAGSTGRCITGIRQQFSTPATIQTAMEAVRLFGQMKEELGMDVEWSNSGYLFLAYDEVKAEMFKQNISIQKKYGLEVEFIPPEKIQALVPLIESEGLKGAAWCPSDGQANPFLVVQGYVRGMRKNGSTIHIGQEVIDIIVQKGRVRGVKTSKGDLFSSPMVINCAGPWAKDVGKLAGNDLPVEPERHEALITEGVKYMGIPMLVDYRSDGGYFVQRVTGQFIGCYTPEKQILGHNMHSSAEFLVEMSRRMCRLIPALENIAVLRQWAGSYCMTPDGSPITDKTDIDGLYCSVGMSGHGFMLGPALGKYLAQYITENTWPFDLSEFAYGRSFGTKEGMA